MDEKLKRVQWLMDQVAAVTGNDEATKDDIEKADAYLVEATGLQAEIVEQEARLEKQAQIDAFMKQTRGRVSRPDPAEAAPPKQEQPEEPPKFKSFGDQMQAVAYAFGPNPKFDPRLKATGLSEGVPSDGGFLVQTDYANEILQRTYENGMVASKARRIPISANANGLKIRAVNETSRATGSRFGGVRGYWAAEAAEKTASTPEWRQLELDLKKLVGLCYATDELLQDTTALGSILTQAFAEEFAWLVDDALVNGTGAGQPLGVLISPSLVSVSAESGQAATTLVAENVIKMWARMWAKSRGNATWFINQDIEAQLLTMSLPVGTGGVPVYLPPGGLSQSPYGSLFGRPVVPIEQCATLGTVGDILLADYSQYLMIDKGGIQSDSSIHVRFIYDESVFRFVYRVDGQPTWNAALTPANGTDTLSPFVAVETRS